MSDRKKIPSKTTTDLIRFVVLDTEATGFHINMDRILSAAVIQIVDGQIDISSVMDWIVFQQDVSLNKASEIHRLLPSEIENGVPEVDVLQEMIPLLSGAVVVGHNIEFDGLMLDAALRRHYEVRFLNQMIDCGAMAMNELIPFHRIGYAKQHTPTLEDLCAHLVLPLHDRHTAEGDAFIAAELFLLLSGRMHRRIGRPLRLRDYPVFRL